MGNLGNLLHAETISCALREGLPRLVALSTGFQIHPPFRIETHRIWIYVLVCMHQQRGHTNGCTGRYTLIVVNEILIWIDARHAGSDSWTESHALHQNCG